MKKKLLKISILSVFSAFLVNCGLSDKNTPEACKFEVSQALDKGNYDTVIQKLTNDPTCGGAYTTEEGKIQLAAAYIGKAGFDIPSLINDIADASDSNKSTFQVFVQSISKKVNNKSIQALYNAKDLYTQIIGNNDCNTSTDNIIKDACFYRNLVDAATATSSLTLALGGGNKNIVDTVNKWTNPGTCDDLNDNNVGDPADVVASAIEYSLNNSCSINGVKCLALNSNLNFTKNSNNYTYTLIEIDVNDVGNNNQSCSTIPYKEYRLIDTTNKTVVLTDGYCKTDFTPCNNLDITNGCYPCPVITNKNALTMNNTVVDLINSTDPNQIANIVGGNNNSTVVQDINKLKKDVCGADLYCTQNEIKTYLTNIK
ncbi:MAG: hypothetical protein D6834_01950 [Aquificota bacterium]|nr:MAG: hypothetical protein D6834_01950 [Aquificota bacterium]